MTKNTNEWAPSSLSTLTDEEKELLTPTDKASFVLNDRIYEVHKQFDDLVQAATNVDQLKDICLEYVGPEHAPGTAGKFKDLLQDIILLDSPQHILILGTCFKGMQDLALSRFAIAVAKCTVLNAPAAPKEWN